MSGDPVANDLEKDQLEYLVYPFRQVEKQVGGADFLGTKYGVLLGSLSLEPWLGVPIARSVSRCSDSNPSLRHHASS
jgi:hypothetical protein